MRKRFRHSDYVLSGKHRFFSSWFVVLCFSVIVLLVICTAFFFTRNTNSFLPSVPSLYKSWNKQDYQAVYDNSGLILAKRPLDGAVLALHGFSAYFLFAEQTDSSLAQSYLNDSVTSLRSALYRVSESEKPQIAYLLGKAYYQRGYYYADLSMKYLNIAYAAGIKTSDIQEFRGLSSALLGDTAASITALTDALSTNKSDLLLFTIARSYQKINDDDKAKQYLYETMRTTKDDLLLLKCHYELGSLFLNEQKLVEAQSEFDTIIEKDPNSADAHYGLGVIYENQGDLIRARAEWRKAIKLDPVHAGARAKLKL
jgi:tetratricopeptide (TPR) repeat protein